MQRNDATHPRTSSRDMGADQQAATSSKIRQALAASNSLAELARSSSLPQMSKRKASGDRSPHGTPREKSQDVLGSPSSSPTSGAAASSKTLSMSDFLKSCEEEFGNAEDGLICLVGQIQACATRVSLLETSQAQIARDQVLHSDHVDRVENRIMGRLYEQTALVQEVERNVQDWGAFCQAERVLREGLIAKHDGEILEVRQLVEQGSDSALRTLDERLRVLAARLEDATPGFSRPMRPIDEEVNNLPDDISSQVASLRAALDEASTRTLEIERRYNILESTFGASSQVNESTVSALVADVKILSGQLSEHLDTTLRMDELEARMRGSLEQLTAELGSQRVDVHRTLADLEARIVDSLRSSLIKDLDTERIYSEHYAAQGKERRDIETKPKIRMVSMLGNGSASTKCPSADEPCHEDDEPSPLLVRTANDRSCPVLPQAASYSPSRSLSSSSIVVVHAAQGMRESKSARSLSLRIPEQVVTEPPNVGHSSRSMRHTLPFAGGFALPSPTASRVSSPRSVMRSGVVQSQPFQHVRRMAPMPSSPPLPTR